jgi:DNA primase
MRGLNVARETLQTDGPVTFDPRGVMRYTGTLELDIRVITLPEGHDPDDLIRENPEAWKELLERAIPVAEYVIQRGTAHLTPQSSYQEREQAARALLPLLTATESDIERSGNIQALARRVRIDERTLLQWTQRRRAERTRAVPSVREQRRLAERPAPAVRAGTSPGHSALREGFCLRLLLEQPERLYAANRLLRELQNGETWLSEVLAPLKPEDFTRPDYQAIFRVLLQALYQHQMEPVDYFYAHLSPELRQVVEELRVTPEEELEQALPRPLRAELRSIRREQARLNAQPEADTRVWLQEVLALRQRFLEREWNELYFLQQDAQLLSGDLTGAGYHEALRANIRARLIISKALSRVKTQSPSW